MIEFLFFIESDLEKQGQRFHNFLKKMSAALLDTLSREEFRSFVVQEESSAGATLKRLLESLTSMEANDDAQLAEQTLRTKQKRVSEVCPTLFSPEESKVFLGMSMLMVASHETDRKAKEDLVNKAMVLLLHDPIQIDMTQVVPVLAKDCHFR